MAPARANLWLRAVALLAVLLFAPSAGAEAFDPVGQDWEGYSDFVEIARAKLGSALVVTQHLDFANLHPEDSLILVHPERRLEVESLASFMGAGGRVVLLDDFGTGDRLLRRFDIRRVPLPPSPMESLRHNPQLAIAEPVGTSEIVRDVTRVVTNHATAFEHPSLTPLLEVRSHEGNAGVLALVGQTSSGKLVAIGDPSTLMNSMLRYPGNAQLARNLASFVARPAGKVYLSTGAFEETGSFAPSPNLPNAKHDAAVPFSLDSVSSLGPRATQILAALIGLGVVIWIGSAAGRTYKVRMPRLTRIIPLFTQGGAAGHAAAVGGRRAPREAAMIEIGNALEAELALALGLPRVPLHEELVGRLLGAGLLHRASATPLRKLLSQVTHIDTLLSAGRGGGLPRLSDDEVLAAARVAAKVREEVYANMRAGRAA